MKHHYGIILCAISALLVLGCSATKQHTLTALEPAQVDLAQNITRIGIINESNAAQESVFKTRLEQMLSQRDGMLKTEGIHAAIAGLFEELQKDQRFETIQLINSAHMEGGGIYTNAEAIPWGKIKAVCDALEVDALFSLSYYETETQVSVKQKAIEAQDMLRQRIRVQGHEITLETLIENGWRIYDPYSKKVIDEIVFNEQITATGQGSNAIYALEDISDRRESVLEQSTQAGSLYGQRLLPQSKAVVRDYYVRGSEKLLAAKKLALQGDLEAAADLWQTETANANNKIKAKACFNMAFYQETQGRYLSALDWAEKAYTHAPNKRAFAYLKTLERRKEQSEIVHEQLQRSRLSASLEFQ